VAHVEKSSIFSLFSGTIFQLSYNNQYPKIALKQFLEDYFKNNFYIRIVYMKKNLKDVELCKCYMKTLPKP